MSKVLPGRLLGEEGKDKTGRGDAVKKHQRLANTVGDSYPLNNEKGAASFFSQLPQIL